MPQTDERGPTPAWTQLRFHRAQQEAFTCPKRFVTIVAGRGSGKTELARRRLVMQLTRRRPWRDPRYFYAADTVGHAKLIAWEQILALIPPHWHACPPREGVDALRIRTIFGSSLHLFGMIKPSKAEGLQWDGGVVDESSDAPPGAVDRSIMPALVWRHGWLWRLGVPERHGIGATEFRQVFEAGLDGRDPDRASFWWPSSEIVEPGTLAYCRRTFDPKDYREQFEASWETAGGGIFWAFDEQQNVGHCAYNPEAPLVVGSDFNVDPMAWVIGHRYTNRLEWLDEIFVRDTNTQAALDILWGRYGERHRGGFEFYGDAAGHQRKTSATFTDYQIIKQDRRFAATPGGARIYYPKANPRIRDRFAATNAMFLSAAGERRMFVSPSCVHLIDDLRMRHYQPGTSEPQDRGDLGHATDAMGYVVWRLFRPRIVLDTPMPTVIISTGQGR